MNYQVVCFGEILFDILGEMHTPGGAPLNVAYHLKQADINSFMISSIGKDHYGKQLLDILHGWNIDTAGIDVCAIHSTGKAVVKTGPDGQPTFELLYPVAWDHIPWKDEYASIIRNAGAFVFGSLASRNKASYNTLLTCLKHSSLNVFDINIRPPYINRTVLEELLSHSHILKLNNTELELLSQWYGAGAENENGRVAAIRQRFSINEIIVTKGEKGASYYSDAINLHSDAIKVDVADTVGSGDAFLAGFLTRRLHAGFSLEECFQEALFKGAYVASQPGACPSYEKYPQTREWMKDASVITPAC